MIARFVTATGTGIGKTLVTAALCHQLRQKGQSVQALKPIVTGLAGTSWSESDPAILLTSLGESSEADPDRIAPFRFAAPLAPSMAAAQEGRRLDLDDIVRFCKAPCAADVLLIEGVGGVMVPLAPSVTVLDWIKAVGAPVILLAGSYLGSLSHTLTALAVLRQAKLPVAGLVISESEDGGVGLAATAAELRNWMSDGPVIALPRIRGADPWRRAPDLTALARQ